MRYLVEFKLQNINYDRNLKCKVQSWKLMNVKKGNGGLAYISGCLYL